MSGHSKWANIKHQKGAADVVKSHSFTKAARAISIAVSQCGGVGDPEHNFHLRLAIEKARELNVPKENIQRAIEKGKGVGADALQQIMYEGYGPSGVAILIEAATDNKQRTVSVIKNLFDRAGFALATPGAVSYLFTRSGELTVPKNNGGMDAILEAALEAGADDVVESADVVMIYTAIGSLSEVKKRLLAKGIQIANTEIIMKPLTPVPYTGEERQSIDAFISELEDLDDVQTIFTNMSDN